MQTGKADINVTPLIDVLLVLLIIFMVITPLAPSGLAADVSQSPKDTAAAPSPLVLEISAQNELSLNGQPLPADRMNSTLRQLYSARPDKVLFLKADKSLQYRDVARRIDQIKGIDPSIAVAIMP